MSMNQLATQGNKDDSSFQDKLIHRLNLIIYLLVARPNAGESPPISEMARRLSDMGLMPSQIGSILGKSSNYVSATLGTPSRIRAKGKNK